LETGDHDWLEIRLIGNTEQDKRDGYQAESHEALPRSSGNRQGNFVQEHLRVRPSLDYS